MVVVASGSGDGLKSAIFALGFSALGKNPRALFFSVDCLLLFLRESCCLRKQQLSSRQGRSGSVTFPPAPSKRAHPVRHRSMSHDIADSTDRKKRMVTKKGKIHLKPLSMRENLMTLEKPSFGGGA